MIKYDSEIGQKIVSSTKNASEIIKDNISSKISTDFRPLMSLGLFSSQISNIENASRTLAESLEDFATVIESSKAAWTKVEEDVDRAVEEFAETVEATPAIPSDTGGRRPSGSSSGGYRAPASKSEQENSKVEEVDKGKEIKNGDVKEMLIKIDDATLPILLQKIDKLRDGESVPELIFDEKKSDIITSILQKIANKKTEEVVPISLETEEIRRIMLEKINKDGIDVSTEEGRRKIEEYIERELNIKYDPSLWYKILYGDNIVIKDELEGKWVVAKTAQDLDTYKSYIEEAQVKQNTKAEWSDLCLSFAYSHTHDLANGTTTSANTAASYAYANDFNDYISDDKQDVLIKVYNEITQGRPVILQVNGNKEGTSRHFVTVVGFKEDVVSGSTMKESDLLIIDSWDGKLERMDTATSRFMTSGADCRKSYTGFRARVLKS